MDHFILNDADRTSDFAVAFDVPITRSVVLMICASLSRYANSPEPFRSECVKRWTRAPSNHWTLSSCLFPARRRRAPSSLSLCHSNR